MKEVKHKIFNCFLFEQAKMKLYTTKKVLPNTSMKREELRIQIKFYNNNVQQKQERKLVVKPTNI